MSQESVTTVVHDFPYEIREIENCWIPMSDGVRLAARIWMPVDAPQNPVPAIIEYIPYRKRDWTRWRDEPMHRYFAGHGYVAVRIDLRGTGDSEGLLHDEYLEQEQLDGVEAIRWIASQPWCDGSVGMMGKSWGGFNSLQIAAHQPAELKSIITVCSTDDRYADDAHYMGGCLLNENFSWGANFFTLCALPPDPEIVGDRWRSMWLDRLNNLKPFASTWLSHQCRDDYWKQGSVCEDFSRIKCPVYAIGGWADGYSNAVPRLLAGLTIPRKGLIGPWGHLYPHNGRPGPAIGFLQEALRWWDQNLKGIDTGILDEPMYRVWMQENALLTGAEDAQPGRWIAEPSWPSLRISSIKYLLRNTRLCQSQENCDLDSDPLTIRSPLCVGIAAGRWCSFGDERELPGDQQSDDAKSRTFQSDPLRDQIEILGSPTVRLAFSSDRPSAFVCIRLNDVAPNGTSNRMSFGVFNLSHLENHENVCALQPYKRYFLSFALNDIAYSIAPGHRIRLAISTSYWPLVYPSPQEATIQLYTNDCALILPTRRPCADDSELKPFPEPETAAPLDEVDLSPIGFHSKFSCDQSIGETTYTVRYDADEAGEPGITHIKPINLHIGHGVIETLSIRENDPLSARAKILHHVFLRRGDWSVRVKTQMDFHASLHDFFLNSSVEACESGQLTYSKEWKNTIARNGI